ncbi:MAG: NHL repeat-containing protein [bacterium]
MSNNHTSHFKGTDSILWLWLFLILLCPALVFLWSERGMSASVSGKPEQPVSVSGKAEQPVAPIHGISASPSGTPAPADKPAAVVNPVTAAPLQIIQVKHLFDIKKEAVIPPLDQPSAVAVDSQKRIWVLDGVNGRLVLFSYDGKYLAQFGKKGSDRGEFKSPLGLMIDSKDRIYVADSKNHRIQVFDDRASPVTEIPVPPDKYRSLSDPTDMAFDEVNQQLVAVDNDNHRLLIYDKKFELLKEVGGVGYENGDFRYPYAICLDKSGNMYVTDVINTRVQVLSPQGEYIRSIGEWGIERGQFFRPQSICMDQQERIFVGENYDKIGLIQVFDQQGNFLGVVGDMSNQKIRFKVPADLCIDQQNRLYVVQMYTSTISVYSIGK